MYQLITKWFFHTEWTLSAEEFEASGTSGNRVQILTTVGWNIQEPKSALPSLFFFFLFSDNFVCLFLFFLTCVGFVPEFSTCTYKSQKRKTAVSKHAVQVIFWGEITTRRITWTSPSKIPSVFHKRLCNYVHKSTLITSHIVWLVFFGSVILGRVLSNCCTSGLSLSLSRWHSVSLL